MKRVKVKTKRSSVKIPPLYAEGFLIYHGKRTILAKYMNIPSFKKMTKKQRVQLLLGIAGLFGVACLLVIAMNFRGVTVEAPEQQEEQSKEEKNRDPFTGALLTGEAEDTRIACVMVENSSDAWPLSGVEDAFFVVEAPVEGGIPRFMACYTEANEVEKIGPVRSARPYYISWAEGFGALYGHVGGSPEALQRLGATRNLTTLNEYSNGSSYWRDTTRSAPHNAYTSTELLWSAATRLSVPAGKSPAWKYGEEGVWESEENCKNITLSWGSAPSYNVTWDCDAASKSYIRLQGTSVAASSDGDTYDAQNVVIMEADMRVVDEVGRRALTTEGMGNAIVCSLGICQDALWSKEGVDKPLQFFNTYPDEPIIFSPGTTWIEVVDDLEKVQ